METFRSPASIRFLFAIVVCFTSGCVAPAQEQAQSSSGVQIIKLHWRKQIRLPSTFDPSKIPTRGVFVDPSSNAPTSLPGSGIDAGRTPSSNPNTSIDSDTFFPATPGRLPVFYVYSMMIKNDGAKMIEGVAWNYVFIDKSSNRELGRHQFLSYEEVGMGKTVTFKSQLRSPPTRVIQASSTRAKHPQMAERAVVQCVLYADDSSWRNQDAPIDACSLLRKNKNLLKQNRRESRTKVSYQRFPIDLGKHIV